MNHPSRHESGPTDSVSVSEADPCQLPAPRPDLEIFRSLRQIIRAVDIHSRRLQQLYGVTGPQLHCLVTLCDDGPMPLKSLADLVHVGNSTITGIIDRLEARGLVERRRGGPDRRVITVHPTDAGRIVRSGAPSLLQEKLSAGLDGLPDAELQQISQALQTVARMMAADQIDASPVVAMGDMVDGLS